MKNDYINITDILESAAACVRASASAREISMMLDEEHAQPGVYGAMIDVEKLKADVNSLSIKVPGFELGKDSSLPVILVAPFMADVVHDDLVCVDVCEKHAIIALIPPDGKCRANSVAIMSRAEITSHFQAVNQNILLPHTRYTGSGVLVFAGEAAQELAIAAGGLNVIMPSSRFSAERFVRQLSIDQQNRNHHPQ